MVMAKLKKADQNKQSHLHAVRELTYKKIFEAVKKNSPFRGVVVTIAI